MPRSRPAQQLIGTPEPEKTTEQTQDGTTPAVVGTGEDTTKADHLPSNDEDTTGKDELEAQKALAGNADNGTGTDPGNVERGADEPTASAILASQAASSTGSNTGAETAMSRDIESDYRPAVMAATYMTSADLAFLDEAPGQYGPEFTRLANGVAERAYERGLKEGDDRKATAMGEGYNAGFAAARAQFTPG